MWAISTLGWIADSPPLGMRISLHATIRFRGDRANYYGDRA
ncbi:MULTISPECIES: hypothetical protein [Planktothricoides]|uniref:Uncharacterized protein n=1 Tax=Planktothricoides raciborskii GIHE-MW2 TaxID=2792601 RepID=A0AAU8JD69_9CYAN|nr:MULTISPECIES: hypothetical protein [Planktothricoides]